MTILTRILNSIRSFFASEPDYSRVLSRIDELKEAREKARRQKKKFSHIQREIEVLTASIVRRAV